VPLLIFAEAPVQGVFMRLLPYFVRSGVMPESELPRFRAALTTSRNCAMRRFPGWQSLLCSSPSSRSPTWYTTPMRSYGLLMVRDITAVGFWRLVVSIRRPADLLIAAPLLALACGSDVPALRRIAKLNLSIVQRIRTAQAGSVF